MSYDIFVVDLPPDIRSVDEIPGDFTARPVGARSAIVDAMRRVVPDLALDAAGWATIEGAGYSVEVNLGTEDPVESFAFHLRGGEEALFVTAAILDSLGLRAVAPGTETGLFTLGGAAAAYATWRTYRDHVTRG